MKSLVLTTANAAAAVQELPVPEPKSNEILVRVHAIALNSVDALYVGKPIAAQLQRVVGSDFAGEVVGVPSSLHDSAVKVGTRVAGFLQGGKQAPQCLRFPTSN